MDVTGAVALVTGGASGLGLATAQHLARLGADVVSVDIDEVEGPARAAEIGATFLHADVRDEDAVAAAVDTAARRGPLRVVANIAGLEGIRRRILNRAGEVHPLEAWDRTLAVNLTGSFNVLRYAATHMASTPELEDGQRGVVVNCASIAGWDGAPGLAAYSSAKAGLQGLTLTAAREFSRFGIRVVCIVPGAFGTPAMLELQRRLPDLPVVASMFPKRVGKPEEFAKLVGHIADNDYLNATVIRLDGGTRMGLEAL